MDKWIEVGTQAPEDSFNKFFLAHLTQEHMWVTRRSHPYDVVSGWYLLHFPHLYTHWINIPEGFE